MPDINEQFFAVIEDFISPDQAEALKIYVVENSEDDRREHYRYMPMGDRNRIFSGQIQDWDPDNIVPKTAHYALNFFKSHYNLDDSFHLDRVFGNIMYEGAKLDYHKDFSYGASIDEHDPRKKTLVAGLFLTDDYEGGEMAFFESQTFTVKPKIGTLMLFTGHSTAHSVNEVLKGARVNILYMFYYTDPTEPDPS